MYIDDSSLNYLVNKPVLGGNIFRWLLLFQEYEFEVIVKPMRLNVGLDHISRIEIGEDYNYSNNVGRILYSAEKGVGGLCS